MEEKEDVHLNPVTVTADLTKPIEQVTDAAVESYQTDGGRKVSKSFWLLVDKGLEVSQIPFDLILAGKAGVIALRKKILQIPKSRRQKVPPQIAGPVLEGIRYLPVADPVFDLYAELLAKAADQTKADAVHPRFIRLLREFTIYEARIMTAVSAGWRIGKLEMEYDVVYTSRGGLDGRKMVPIYCDDFPSGFVESSERFRFSLGLLEDQGLLVMNKRWGTVSSPPSRTTRRATYASLTPSGEAFCQVCVSEEAVKILETLIEGDIPKVKNERGIDLY